MRLFIRCGLFLILLAVSSEVAFPQMAADLWAGRRGTLSIQTLLGGSVSSNSGAPLEEFTFSSSFQAGMHWRFGTFALSLVGGIDNRGQVEYSTLDSVTYTSAHVSYWRVGPRFSLCVGQIFTGYLSIHYGEPLSAEFRNDSRSLSIIDSTEIPPFFELGFGMQGKIAKIWHGILFAGFEYGELSEHLFESWRKSGTDGFDSGDPTRAIRLSIGYEIPFYNLPTDDE